MSRETLKGVILCAGRGLRLQGLSDGGPKCLLRLSGRTILDRCLDDFQAAGVEEIVLVAGYRRDLVERFIADRAASGVSIIVNDRFAETNTACSLNLALRVLDSDFLLANGDVLFDRTILEDLARHPAANCVAVDADIPLEAEEVKVIGRDGWVVDIGKHLAPRTCLGEAIGLYKIAREIIPGLRRIYDDLEARGEFHHFFERGFERLLAESGGADRMFGMAFTARRPWVEIDTPEDLAYAQREIAPRLRS
ncbi:MAG: phosphocholine cytidylyltransferase family protein [Candidatus Aminicenantes bacterium]|nr:phosphocholine cytidylyltransferase family protein [Candidatus Aminicenantes bacterium]